MINYSSNLRDKQRQVIKNILKAKARKRKHSLRDIMNTVMYLTKKGCQLHIHNSEHIRSLTLPFGILLYLNEYKQKVHGVC